ncbi:MAG: hypothetical protein ACYC7E_17640 [Armatimonadota bacterium]
MTNNSAEEFAMLLRASKPTLTPFGLHHGETLRFTLRRGAVWEMTLLETSAEVVAHEYATYGNEDTGHGVGDISVYAFSCIVSINGREHCLRREVGSQASFYDPWTIAGVNIWFDAAACAFARRGGFMVEKDERWGFVCAPDQDARFAVHEADLPICPEPLHPWYPNPTGRLDIHDCYCGEDCWMGPYGGIAAHCGLDINMPAGTVLTTPIAVDDQFLFHSTAAGFNNNRWRGVRRWPDGSEWYLQTHHLIDMLVPERTPLPAGVPYATTAGVAVGYHEHTHFLFQVLEQGGAYWLDPWILFWTIFRQG